MRQARPYFGKKQIRSVAELEVGKRYVAMEKQGASGKFIKEGAFTVFGKDIASGTCEAGELEGRFRNYSLVTKGLGFSPTKTIDLRWYSVVPFSKRDFLTEKRWCSISYLIKDASTKPQSLEILNKPLELRDCTLCLGYGFLARRGEKCLSCHGEKGKYSTAYNEPGDQPYWDHCMYCVVGGKSTGKQQKNVSHKACASQGKILSKPFPLPCLYCNGEKLDRYCDFCGGAGFLLIYNIPGISYEPSVFERMIQQRIKSDEILDAQSSKKEISYYRVRFKSEGCIASKKFPESLYLQKSKASTLAGLLKSNPQLFLKADDNGVLILGGLHRNEETTWQKYLSFRRSRMPSGFAVTAGHELPRDIKAYILSLAKGSQIRKGALKIKVVGASWKPSEYNESSMIM